MISIDIHDADGFRATANGTGEFSWVWLQDSRSNKITLYFSDYEKAERVARAFNAALADPVKQAAE